MRGPARTTLSDGLASLGAETVGMRRWLLVVCCGCCLAAIGARGGAEVFEPLGYPASIGDEGSGDTRQPTARDAIAPPEPAPPPPIARGSDERRADEPQVPAGLDPWRMPAFAKDPGGLLTWFQEPEPASPCDLNLVDPAWMGPGELAYHLSSNRCRCSRDHTRAFRSEFLGRLWVEAEYLLWATSPQSLPPLITASPSGTAVADVGVLGRRGTAVLFGGGDAEGPMRSGGRISGGYWFDPTQHRGIAAGWFGLTEATTTTAISSSGGTPWLARPYRNAASGQQAAVIVPPPGGVPTDPALLSQALAATQTTAFSGVDVRYLHSISCERFHRRYLLGGWRYFMLDDALVVRDVAAISTGTPGGLPREGYAAADVFRSLTQFNGGEFGIVERWWRERASLQVIGTVALGASGIGTSIGGGTIGTETTGTPGAATTVVTSRSRGGLLAQPTNIGSYDTSLFAAAGEVGVAADYALWSQCRLSVGYTFLWLSTVGRAAGQVDTTVNPTQLGGGTLVGPARPAFQLDTTGFWAQGVSLGLDYQF
jgi:hypothetical protein